MGEAGPLAAQRQRIDVIDAALVGLLAERMAVVREVVAIKAMEGLAPRLPDRVEAVVARVRAQAAGGQCPPALAEAVWRTIVEWTIAFEERSLADVAKGEL